MDFKQAELIASGSKHVWHPCAMISHPVNHLAPAKALGSYIYLTEGEKVIDAISSWWCKSLGHGHPRLRNAAKKQIAKFEHVVFANTTSEVIVKLSEKLSALQPSLNKVFYASDGSCAVEIAMKMSIHANQILGHTQRTGFISLANSYHGETLGSLSVSDAGAYRRPYYSMLFKTTFIPDIPYVLNVNDPLWHDCSEHWNNTEKLLEPIASTTTAVIVEPIVQAVNGMRIYSQDFLKHLRKWTQKHGIHLIADEIMTGIGRTGKMLACEHSGIEADFICLGKGLTSGWVPMSAVVTREDIYQLLCTSDIDKPFLHSHTYSGNALAASIALEVLNIVEEEKLCEQAVMIGKTMKAMMEEISLVTKKITNVRSLGAIAAADLICDDPSRKPGVEVCQEATLLGALMRPLGNTIYWLPPLNIENTTLQELKDITEKAILSL